MMNNTDTGNPWDNVLTDEQCAADTAALALRGYDLTSEQMHAKRVAMAHRLGQPEPLPMRNGFTDLRTPEQKRMDGAVRLFSQGNVDYYENVGTGDAFRVIRTSASFRVVSP